MASPLEGQIVGAPQLDKGTLHALDTGIGHVVEICAALIVALETLVLFGGVISRLLRTPFTWSDEFASILFLWLAMLGSVIALRRSEHMRLTTFAALAPAGLRPVLEALAWLVPIVFLCWLLPYAIEHTATEWMVLTASLEWPVAVKVGAIPTGAALMIILALIRLFERVALKEILIGVAVIAGIAVIFWFSAPALTAMGRGNLVVFFVLLVGVAVLIGVPIGFAFGIATIAYLATVTRTPLTIVVGRMDEGMSHIVLLSVPLFVFLGYLIDRTGLARTMVGFLAALVGHVRAGLAYVLLAAMYLVSGISGSKAADMAAVTPVLFPEMKERGYRPGELVALLSASGAMSETIPPSLVLITLGSVVSGVSIADLFVGGLMPALILALALCAVCWWRFRGADVSFIRKASWGDAGRALLLAMPALSLPIAIRAAVVEGWATATEVSALGIGWTFIIGLVFAPLLKQKFPWRHLYGMLVATAALSGAILLIIGAATAMSWALTQSGFSRQLAEIMAVVPGGKIGFMAISIVAFVILGSILEGIPAIVLFGPLLFPIARQLGIHEVHYAMVVILAMGIGLFAPPFGVGYFAACAIGRVDPDEGVRPIWPYLLALLIGLVVVAAVPWISTGFLSKVQ
jgi:tripartite ATP-independent transporter DctM subunit